MQRDNHDTSTATAAARPAAEVLTAAVAGVLFITTTLAVAMAPRVALVAVAAVVAAAALRVTAPQVRTTVRAVLARVTAVRA